MDSETLDFYQSKTPKHTVEMDNKLIKIVNESPNHQDSRTTAKSRQGYGGLVIGRAFENTQALSKHMMEPLKERPALSGLLKT